MCSYTDIIYDSQGVGYSNHTLTKGSPIRGSYTVKDGTETVMGVAFRKREQLSSVVFPEGLLLIGDASFSHCKALKKVTIPASVEHIGVAAFCCSGLEEVVFLGIPKVIEASLFKGCENLRVIIVPKDSKLYFAKYFDSLLIKEDEESSGHNVQEYHSLPGRVIMQLDIFGESDNYYQQPNLFAQPISAPPILQQENSQINRKPEGNNQECLRRSKLTYNFKSFSWIKGDQIKLSDLFSGPLSLIGDPSYQFRRKYLFVFMKSHASVKHKSEKQYSIPANTAFFARKYKEKYGTRMIRIFLFECIDGKNAIFYDEASFVSIGNNEITIKSVL